MAIYDHMWGTNFIRMLKINTILYNVLGRIIWSQNKDVIIEYAKFFIAQEKQTWEEVSGAQKPIINFEYYSFLCA